MVYRAIGLMSGSSLDGLDIVFAEFNESGGQWSWQISACACREYDEEWRKRLSTATLLPAGEYLQLHADYGHYLGREVNRFIEEKGIQYQVALVASHGHTTFHRPASHMTAQLGDGAAIAAETRLPVVSDLRSLDVALGGQGAPIVPAGEKALMAGYDYYLNIGGITNISAGREPFIAFDICPANRVLNMLAALEGREMDENGELASAGRVNESLLQKLNALPYYQLPYPRSLANDFGTDIIYPMLTGEEKDSRNALRTYTEHIAIQVALAAEKLQAGESAAHRSMLVTGGGAFNGFLISRLEELLTEQNTSLVIPEVDTIRYKEALVMAFLGVLRWREEYTVLSSVTGARASSIGGALWNGQEA